MNIAQFLSILKARWLPSLIVFVLAVAAAGIASVVIPKRYTATAAVLVDTKTTDPLLGGMAALANMGTQIEVIKSDRVAQRVVRDLRLTENPNARQAWMEDTNGNGNYEAWVASLMNKALDAKPAAQSNIINVSYVGADPKFAAGMANAFVKAYIDTSLELRIDPARRNNTFFDDRAKELRDNLETTQAKLSAYQRQHGILVTDERLDIETQRLNELSSQLVSVQAAAMEARSRSAQARTSADQFGDVINNPLVAGLRADLNQKEAALQQLSARLGDANPQVVELKANIAEVRQRMESETKRVSSSVNINSTISTARESDIRSALDAQRAKVLRMREQRDEVNVMQREVENAQRAYDAVMMRATQTSIESQNNQTNIALLAPAVEPISPSTPKPMPQMLGMGAMAGLALAVGLALLLERMDRRVRTAEDLNTVLGLPVLGNLPKPLPGLSTSGGSGSLLLPNNVLGRLPAPRN